MRKSKVHIWILKNKFNILLLFCSLLVGVLLIGLVGEFSGENVEGYYVWPPLIEQTFLPDTNVFNGVSGKSFFSINEKHPGTKDV